LRAGWPAERIGTQPHGHLVQRPVGYVRVIAKCTHPFGTSVLGTSTGSHWWRLIPHARWKSS